jgi:hypothetical protein
MMRLVMTILLLAASALSQTATPAPAVAQLLGTWRLVSIVDTLKDGTSSFQPELGPHPIGFIMYEPDGHMCASIMNPDRPAWKDPVKATDAEKITSFDTFIAYCGTFKLDSEHSTVTHYPEVAWMPSYVGSTQPRPFRLEGNRLIITAKISNPAVEKRTLVWERKQ